MGEIYLEKNGFTPLQELLNAVAEDVDLLIDTLRDSTAEGAIEILEGDYDVVTGIEVVDRISGVDYEKKIPSLENMVSNSLIEDEIVNVEQMLDAIDSINSRVRETVKVEVVSRPRYAPPKSRNYYRGRSAAALAAPRLRGIDPSMLLL